MSRKCKAERLERKLGVLIPLDHDERDEGK